MTDEIVSRIREHAATAWTEILNGAVPAETDNFCQTGGTSLKQVDRLLDHVVYRLDMDGTESTVAAWELADI